MSDEQLLASSLPPGARCAIHPERAAEHTCVRCGNYMCSECGASDGHCLTCASRMGAAGGAFPYSRDNYTLDGLLRLAWSRWKEHWTVLLPAFAGAILLVYGLMFGGEAVFMLLPGAEAFRSPLHPLRLAYSVVLTILHVAVQLALFGLCLDVLRGQRPDLRAALARVRKLPASIVQGALIYATVGVDLGLHVLLFYLLGGFAQEDWIAPLRITIGVWLALSPLRIYVALGLVFTRISLLTEPEVGALGGFARSWRITAGHRFEVLGIGFVTLLILCGGVLACCVGIFVAAPIASLLYSALFLALSTAPRPPGRL